MNATSVALPRTYHQLMDMGTGCSTIGRMLFENPSRRSNHSTMDLMLVRSPHGQGSRLDLDVAVLASPVVLEQPVWRRPAGDRAIGVIDATVTWAQEQF